jgi:hypothetical protein
MAGWKRSNGVDTYHQEDMMNCGMACLCMVINFVKGDKLTSYMIAHESKSVGGWSQYVRANKDNPTMRPAMLVMAGPEQVLGRTIRGAFEGREDSGTGADNLPKVLRRFGIESRLEERDLFAGDRGIFSRQKLKETLNAASKSRPVIVQIEEPSHFCVCVGHSWQLVGSNLYAMADPADGQLHTAGHVSDRRLIFGGYNSYVIGLITVTGTKSLSANRTKVLPPVPPRRH